MNNGVASADRINTYNSLTDLVNDSPATSQAPAWNFGTGILGLAHDGNQFIMPFVSGNGTETVYTYANLADLATNTQTPPGGQSAFNYGSNIYGLAATIIPEPSTFALATFGLLGLGLLVLRRRK